MQPAVLIRLRPLGPWRIGPGEGGRHQIDTIFRSDRLYSALTLAAESLGFLEEWLDATARAQTPAVVFSSLFPYQGDTLFAPPPLTIWPPAASSVTSPSPVFLSKMRWEAARFIPVTTIETLLGGQPILAEQWVIDAESGCLLRRDRPSQSPFRIAVRTRVAVDRISQTAAHLHSSACVEFESSSGLWLIIRFKDEAAEATWSDRIKACFRLLADTGFGGHRSSGWGQTADPEFRSGRWPGLLVPHLERLARSTRGNEGAGNGGGAPLFWLLSLYSPSPADEVDWSLGNYGLVVRGGRIQSSAHAGDNALKKNVRMVAEGSVLAVQHEPVGTAVDVAPDGFAHPVYRLGFSLSLKLPNPKEITDSRPVETTSADSPLEAGKEPETEKDTLAPVPEATEIQEIPSAPEATEIQEIPSAPEATEIQEIPSAPETVDIREAPTVPEISEREELSSAAQEQEEPVSETPNEESERSDNEI
jgi:CRISPR type III-A-associated RAMP protein Csm4